MIAVDTNLLVYAHRRESRYREAASSIMRSMVEGDALFTKDRDFALFPELRTRDPIAEYRQ